MKFAYADPPYLGCGKRLYGEHHTSAADWDKIESHISLIGRLVSDYPDGWALSLHVPSLRRILPICPDSARISAWVKPFAVWYPGVRVCYAWEPVIWAGGRRGRESNELLKDWCMANSPAVVPGRNDYIVPGQKPREFCRWIFGLLGATADDTLDDLFPGNGAVGAAWAEWCKDKSPLPELPLFLR
jgi:hypothetical protein